MKLLKSVRKMAGVSALVLGATAIQAQETNQLNQLQRQLEQMQANFDRVVREQQAQIEALKKQVAAMSAQERPPAATNAFAPAVAPVAAAAATLEKAWSPTDPIRVGKGGTYADIGFVATFAAGGSTADDISGGTQLGGHDPQVNGFTVQGAELNLQGAVDPFFRANANIAFTLDSSGETGVELEEAWLETVSLPWNLQLRGGQILTEFGRVNTQHPHGWAFVDVPLVNGRFLGEDGLRNPGARLSWLAPTPFYSELFFSVQNAQGGTAHSFDADHDGDAFLGRLPTSTGADNAADLLYTARYAASFDLNDTQTMLAGLSAAFGPNSSGEHTDTQIYGADVYWKWKPANAHGGFPFVSFQAEAMLRRYELAAAVEDLDGDNVFESLPAETLTDWGFYTQVLYGFKNGWVAGLRGDWVGRTDQAEYEKIYGDDPDRLARWRISPNLTWYPSEFSKIRLQYNCDERQDIGVDHSVWLQFEFLLGAHAAHKF